MSGKIINRNAPGTVSAAKGDSQHGQGGSGRLAARNGRHAVLSMTVEEIFLEGDSATVLQHEAGSAQTMGLLKFADTLDPEGDQAE